MTISEGERYRLYEAARGGWGDDVAETLMRLLPPVGWADVATRHDLTSEIALLRADMKAEFAHVRGELKAEIAGVRTELNGEIGGVNAAMASQTRTLVFTVVASNATFLWFAFAAARFA
ncbi:MAG: hypothetical protein ACRD29_01030 [Acidimicrobiales bacterium]